MSRRDPSGFSIGKRRAPSQQRFTPSVRGVSGASPALAQGVRRSPTPSVRGTASARGSRNQNTPGLRRSGGSKKNDRLGPAQGQILTEGRVNGIHVRVSAPNAPNPDNSRNRVIDTKARERNIQADLPPDMMAAQSTQMIAGQQPTGRGRRPRVEQLPKQPPVVETTAQEKVEEPAMPAGTYWSDKYEAYIEPTDERYSEETARRLGAA